jgi:hypothetical protein
MRQRSRAHSPIRWLAAGTAAAAGAYATYAGVTWLRYGRACRAAGDASDPLLDRFMPNYEVVERHHIQVHAPAVITLAAAREMELSSQPLVRAIFRARELILGATPDERRRPRGLLAEMESLGWAVLEDIPGREIVVGAVTRPWQPDVTFRAVPAGDFAAFAEPDYVKIAWTLRADPDGARSSTFRTETRAIATDAAARATFRRYWALLSPGIALIRRLLLRPLKAEAERRAREEGSRQDF